MFKTSYGSIIIVSILTEYAWLGLVLLMLFELLATFSYNIVYMFTSELFPTYTRHSLHALCAAAGRLGALLAPQVPLLVSINICGIYCDFFRSQFIPHMAG